MFTVRICALPPPKSPPARAQGVCAQSPGMPHSPLQGAPQNVHTVLGCDHPYPMSAFFASNVSLDARVASAAIACTSAAPPKTTTYETNQRVLNVVQLSFRMLLCHHSPDFVPRVCKP